MCLIMIRNPGVILDRDKWDAAVVNNPDGWGISVPDMNGKLITKRSSTTDSDELYALLHGELKDDKVLIHLRFTTAGETSLRNAHPFPVLEHSRDGVDMRMCHNGTLFDWKPRNTDEDSWSSDSRRFVLHYVRPLMKLLIKGTTSEDLLTDPFVSFILDDQLTTQSVLAFIDGYGNTNVINEKGNGGFTDEDGTYFSNKYSHDLEHRVPFVKKTHGGGTTTTLAPNSTRKTMTGGTASTSYDDLDVERFTTKHGVEDTETLMFMGDQAIEAFVKEEPDDAVLLIKELLEMWYKKSEECTALKAKLNSKTKGLRPTVNAKEDEDDQAA